MTIPRLNALMEYWKKNPPVHLLVAAAMGLKPQEPPSEDLSGLFAELGGVPGITFNG